MVVKERPNNEKPNIIQVPQNVTEGDKEKAKEEIKTYLDKILDVTSSKEKFEEYLSKNDINTFNASWIAASYLAQKLGVDSAILKEINENINKRAEEMGYEVKTYDLGKFEGKHIEDIRAILKTDFGAEPFGDVKFFEGLKIDIPDNTWNSILNPLTGVAVAATGGPTSVIGEEKKENEEKSSTNEALKKLNNENNGGLSQTPTEGQKEQGNEGNKGELSQGQQLQPQQKEKAQNMPKEAQKIIEKYEEKVNKINGKEFPHSIQRYISKITNMHDKIIDEINDVNSKLSAFSGHKADLLKRYSEDLDKLNSRISDIIVNKKKGLEGLNELSKYLNDMTDTMKNIKKDIEVINKEKELGEIAKKLKLASKIDALASNTDKAIKKVETEIKGRESKISKLNEEKEKVEKKYKETEVNKKQEAAKEEKAKQGTFQNVAFATGMAVLSIVAASAFAAVAMSSFSIFAIGGIAGLAIAGAAGLAALVHSRLQKRKEVQLEKQKEEVKEEEKKKEAEKAYVSPHRKPAKSALIGGAITAVIGAVLIYSAFTVTAMMGFGLLGLGLVGIGGLVMFVGVIEWIVAQIGEAYNNRKIKNAKKNEREEEKEEEKEKKKIPNYFSQKTQNPNYIEGGSKK